MRLRSRALDAWVLPDPRQLLGEIKNASRASALSAVSLLFAAALVVFRGIGMTAQLVVPFRLERICDETVVGIDLHVTSPRELGLVAHPFDVLAARGVGLSGARLQLALNLQGHRQGHRCHHLDQQGRDRCIDDLARDGLAGLARAAHRGLSTDIGRDRAAMLLAVMHAHALAAQTTQHPTLKQRRSLARRP